MSLAELHDPRAVRRGGTCTVTRIRADLTPDDLAWLDAALAAHPDDEPAAGIARTLTAAGHPIKGQTVARHRRGECTCE
jgi:hypothetical protein